jgi:signal transduction histidine kinase/CheY-like chemotaxis protein/HAMP domain-containing protein
MARAKPGNASLDTKKLLATLRAIRDGDFTARVPADGKGNPSAVAAALNGMLDLLENSSRELVRVARAAAKGGKLRQRVRPAGPRGGWAVQARAVNALIRALARPTKKVAHVLAAVARGDLTQRLALDEDGCPLRGDFLRLGKAVNALVDQLAALTSEVTRVAREVGTEGKLGGQADVKGVSGTWKDLTDSVNSMAGNLTSQVRGIAKVVTAVANGDLKQQLTVEAKGEIAALADTINGMIDTLATFTDQVTTVAREVGVEGKLGGQAKVPGAAGTWRDLTSNVNLLSRALTTQVRAIAQVATAVAKGDLTRAITVEAQGEMAALKDDMNEMIRNLRETTRINTEQDWLKTNLAKFSRMLQGQKDLNTVGRLILSELAPVVSSQQAVFYVLDGNKEPAHLTLLAGYADRGQGNVGNTLGLGEGLVGQCALEKRKIHLTGAPPDYIRISSGLGAAPPRSIIVLPVIFEGQVKGVLELASFERFNPIHEAFLDQLTESIGIVLNTIEANMRTEDLLKQSQSLAQQLQSRQQELQKTNQELQEKAGLLAHQNQEVERKNREVEQARQALEDKAKQLALTSKYKSEFLANMSHELRTPLNSLLILSDQLSKNPEGNLLPKQKEFAKTIHSAGNDLLMLINDILDLSKIESGTVVVDVGELRLDDLHSYVERTFRHVAESKGVGFDIRLEADLPKSMFTDAKRLQQIVKNLLSNAFKFTRQGQVALTVEAARSGWNADNEELNRAPAVLAISVEDTGIGIPPDKQQIIFEAFQQADGSTSRKYGGTGLGLAISRELSRLLGGEIRLVSSTNRGSKFSLYLPQIYTPPRASRKASTAEAPATPPAPPVPPPMPLGAPDAEPGTGTERLVVRPLGNGTAAPRRDVLAPEPGAVALINEAGDDRDHIQLGDRVLLIVENYLGFSRFLLDAARERGFKGLVTSLGAAALAMTREYKPAAITLDIFLPDIEGWRVLDRLKNDIGTRHVPVCVVSTDEARARALDAGALAFVAKPIKTRETVDELLDWLRDYVGRAEKSVLVVEPEAARRDRIVGWLGQDVRTACVADGAAAARLLRERTVDCVVVSPQAPGLEPLATAEDGRGDGVVNRLPVIVFGDGKEPGDGPWAKAVAGCTVRIAHSPERLLDQAALVLHREVAKMPGAQRQMLEGLHSSARVLPGKKVLTVDDDLRNIFALSTVLEEHDMVIVSADNGRDAIKILQAQPDVDIVLMDIMMPEMDGIDTMRAIRKIPQLKKLPIIAVTAKAMKGDREKCIEAGAWDYLSKPVDTEQLLAVLRAWLHR